MTATDTAARERPKRYRGFDVAKHMTLQEILSALRVSRKLVIAFRQMEYLPNERNVREFTLLVTELEDLVGRRAGVES